MSEELQLQVSKLIDKELENKKIAAWGGFGKQLYHAEIIFQLRQQKIVEKLVNPRTAEEIAAAEAALAIVKKERKALVDERIAITTNRFDPVIARLMKPEKDIATAIAANEAAILKAKQSQAEEQKIKANKEKELIQVAEQVRTYIADMHAAYLQAQVKLLKDAYTHALEAKKTLEELPEYLKKVKARLTVANRTTPPPKIIAKYNTQDIVDTEIKKHFTPWSPQQYIDGFAIDVDAKFTDWDLALKNPEQATELNNNEYAVTLEAIEDQKAKETVTAKLEAIACPIVEGTPTTKALKEVYKLEEPETIAEAMVIINAFTVNQKITIPNLTKIKPINLGVKQMIAALEDIKNKDNNFEFTGLNFKLIQKL